MGNDDDTTDGEKNDEVTVASAPSLEEPPVEAEAVVIPEQVSADVSHEVVGPDAPSRRVALPIDTPNQTNASSAGSGVPQLANFSADWPRGGANVSSNPLQRSPPAPMASSVASDPAPPPPATAVSAPAPSVTSFPPQLSAEEAGMRMAAQAVMKAAEKKGFGQCQEGP